jgi:hypothetical protein
VLRRPRAISPTSVSETIRKLVLDSKRMNAKMVHPIRVTVATINKFEVNANEPSTNPAIRTAMTPSLSFQMLFFEMILHSFTVRQR